MKIYRLSVAVCGVALLIPVFASAQTQNEDAVKQLVQAFRMAEQNYDVASLTHLIDNRYVEVSPAGEVDEHDRFLGFYTPDKKVEWPPVSVSEEQVRVFGDTAVDILKLTYQMPGADGAVHAREIRASFVAQKRGGEWKLLGSQYTGVRPPAGK